MIGWLGVLAVIMLNIVVVAYLLGMHHGENRKPSDEADARRIVATLDSTGVLIEAEVGPPITRAEARQLAALFNRIATRVLA